MYPQMMNQAARLAPLLQRLMSRGGSFATPFWKTNQIDVPEVTAQPLPPGGAPATPSVPISRDNSATPTTYSAGMSPQDRINDVFGMFPGIPMPRPRPQEAPQAQQMQQAPSVPMPQPRPPEAPQSPEMGFFQRNTAMMTDPMTGAFIDPMAAAQAQAVRGPDLINKMMAYLHNKEIG